jgi:riboflavin kinase / FMN adenylyltransferase
VDVIHGLPAHGDRSKPVALAVGTFDGVHLGHRRLLARLVEEAAGVSGEPAVVTFDPHPRCVVDPSGCPPTLAGIDERVRQIRESGIDRIVVQPFTRDFSRVTADRFCDALMAAFPVRKLVGGPGFAVGHQRAGDLTFLRAYGASHGFDVITVDPLMRDGAAVSSSRIRAALLEGRLAQANDLLGRPYRLTGTVEHGARTGTRIGFPTVNLSIDTGRCIPATGIYAAWCTVDDAWHAAAASIGFRPTFGGTTLTVEAFLLDFSGDLYGKHATLEFVERLRDEEHFASVEALVAQMHRDVEQVRALLATATTPS